MPAFTLTHEPGGLLLALEGEFTIADVRDCHAALSSELRTRPALRFDFARLTRIDLAGLQVVLAAAAAGENASCTEPGAEWPAACERFGVADPFTLPRKTG